MLPALLLAAWQKRQNFGPAAKRRAGIRRVVAYGAFVAAGLGLFAMRSAKAHASEAAYRLGRDLQPLADVIKAPQQLVINGQRINVNVSTATQDIHTLYGRFKGYCESNAALNVADWTGGGTAEGVSQETKEALFSLSATSVGADNGREAYILCFARGDGPADRAQAMVEFTRTNDLAALGKLRYAFMRKLPNGNTQTTILWADDHLDVSALAAEGGKDVAGTDPQLAPRPPDSQRTLEASLIGRPDVVRGYHARGSAAQTVEFYNSAMKERGFHTMTLPTLHDGMRGYDRGDSVVMVTVLPDPDGMGGEASNVDLIEVRLPTATKTTSFGRDL